MNSRMSPKIGLWLIVVLVSLVACERKNLHGTTEDNFGKAVVGAAVRIQGSAFATTSDPEGRFELEYAPGNFTLEASAPGHLRFTRDMNIASRIRYPLEGVRLTRLPPDDGFRVQTAVDYELIRSQRFPTRRRLVDRFWGAHCQDTVVPEGLQEIEGTTFLAFTPPAPQRNWALLQPEGGVLASAPTHMMASNCMFSDVNQVKVTYQELDRLVMLRAELKPGVYCLTQVSEGMFSSTVSPTGACFRWRPSRTDADATLKQNAGPDRHDIAQGGVRPSPGPGPQDAAIEYTGNRGGAEAGIAPGLEQ